MSVRKQDSGLHDARKIVAKELSDLPQQPNMTIIPATDMCVVICFNVKENSLWKGAQYLFTLTLPSKYPFVPPIVHCKTKIYHPNIDQQGNVGLHILQDWKQMPCLGAVIESLAHLFVEPDERNLLNQEAAELMRRNVSTYQQNIRRSLQPQIENALGLLTMSDILANCKLSYYPQYKKDFQRILDNIPDVSVHDYYGETIWSSAQKFPQNILNYLSLSDRPDSSAVVIVKKGNCEFSLRLIGSAICVVVKPSFHKEREHENLSTTPPICKFKEEVNRYYDVLRRSQTPANADALEDACI